MSRKSAYALKARDPAFAAAWNAALKTRAMDVKKLIDGGFPALPTTIALEKATNPFLRADDPALMKAVAMTGRKPAEVFKEVRTRKDQFKG